MIIIIEYCETVSISTISKNALFVTFYSIKVNKFVNEAVNTVFLT